MQYIKHYYVDDEHNTFCCEEPSSAKYKRHPWKEYPGLDVKVWLSDSDGVDVMLAELPDSTTVSTIVSDCGKNSIQILTESKYNSVSVPYFEAQTLFDEAETARQNDDETLAVQKQEEGELKFQEALIAIHAL
jgi:hypothetical protein